MVFKEITKKHVVVGLANEEAAEDLLGTVFTQDPIEIIGKGQGATKTTSAIHGITITEEFGIGDEIYAQWQVPELIDSNEYACLHLEFVPITSEIGKDFSLQINISPNGIGDNLGDLGTQFDIIDISLPITALESFGVELIIPKTMITPKFNDLHIRIKRVTGSNDSIGDVALHHASMEYQKYQR